MNDTSKIKQLLDESYSWPAGYTFKFIVPGAKLAELKKAVGEAKTSEKASRKGTYISLTATKVMKSADDVIATYQKISTIEGVVSL